MPSSRAVLIDISTAGADPAVPHTAIGASGRLRFAGSTEAELAPSIKPNEFFVSPEPASIQLVAVPEEILSPVTAPVTAPVTTADVIHTPKRGFGRKKKDAVADKASDDAVHDNEPQLA